jgi:hypothetical protein
VFDSQLTTTFLYDQPAAAAAADSPALIATMTRVRDFSFRQGPVQGASSADAVGMAFPWRQDAGRSGPCHAALRRQLHEAGRRRQALTTFTRKRDARHALGHRHMRRNDRMIAGAVPILALLVLYLVMAAQRHALNPGDKILPLPDAMARGLSALLFQADPLSGHFLFWTDTFASLERLGLGLALATLSALVAGLVLGVLPPVRATLGRW